jgi:hypothetical protein
LHFHKQTERFDKMKYQGIKIALALTLRRDTVWLGMQGSGLLKQVPAPRVPFPMLTTKVLIFSYRT